MKVFSSTVISHQYIWLREQKKFFTIENYLSVRMFFKTLDSTCFTLSSHFVPQLFFFFYYQEIIVDENVSV